MKNINQLIFLLLFVIITALVYRASLLRSQDQGQRCEENRSTCSQAEVDFLVAQKSQFANFIWPTVEFSQENPQPMNKSFSNFQFRQNKERNDVHLILKWPVRLKKIWSSEKINIGVHSASKSSPMSDGEYVYVGTDGGLFMAYKVSDGQKVWTYRMRDADKGVHGTAAVDEGAVYFGSYEGAVYKLNKKTGELIWKRKLGHALGASPLLVGEDLVWNVEVVPDDGFLVKMNKNSGQISWISPALKAQSHSSPVYSEKFDLVIVGANNNTIQAFALSDGKRKWLTETLGAVKSTGVLVEDHVYYSTWGNDLVGLRVVDGQRTFYQKLETLSMASAVADFNQFRVFVSDQLNHLFSYSIKNQTQLWKVNFDPSLRQQSSPVLLKIKNNSALIITCRRGFLCLVDAESGRLKNSWPIERQRVSSVPLVRWPYVFISYDRGPLVAYKFE